MFCIPDQKRDSGGGTLTSTSDKSSGMKSTSTPSTPQAENSNFHAESRLSHSVLTESSPSADLLTDAIEDTAVAQDKFIGQETPMVCNPFCWSATFYKCQYKNYVLLCLSTHMAWALREKIDTKVAPDVWYIW